MAVIAIADKGNLLHAPDMYMEKSRLVQKPGKISLDDPIEKQLKL